MSPCSHLILATSSLVLERCASILNWLSGDAAAPTAPTAPAAPASVGELEDGAAPERNAATTLAESPPPSPVQRNKKKIIIK